MWAIFILAIICQAIGTLFVVFSKIVDDDGIKAVLSVLGILGLMTQSIFVWILLSMIMGALPQGG